MAGVDTTLYTPQIVPLLFELAGMIRGFVPSLLDVCVRACVVGCGCATAQVIDSRDVATYSMLGIPGYAEAARAMQDSKRNAADALPRAPFLQVRAWSSLDFACCCASAIVQPAALL